MKRAHATFLFTSLTLLLLGACSRVDEAPAESSTEIRPTAAANSPELDHFVADARLAHRQAEAVEAESDTQQGIQNRLKAADQLRQVFLARGVGHSGEVIPVKQDLAARAGRLYFEAGDLKNAALVLNQGLSLSRAPSALRAQLLITLADVEESQGDPARARAALMEALQVNNALLSQELMTP